MHHKKIKNPKPIFHIPKPKFHIPEPISHIPDKNKKTHELHPRKEKTQKHPSK